MVFSTFEGDRAASFQPQSKDTEFRPKLLILLSRSKLRSKVGRSFEISQHNEDFFIGASCTVMFYL